MLQTRYAEYADRERIRELWKLCFGDSEAFMDWFFSERYFPEFSSVLEEDGVIMSALHSYPLHIRIRNRILPASMLAGVSTHPERNGRGYMKQIFLHYMQRVHALEIPVAIHTPAHLPTFFSRGHFPAADTLHATMAGARGELPEGVARQSLYEGLAPLQACYQKATGRYSGCVSRTLGDFAYKCRDYASDGGLCLVCRQGEDVLGYAIYYVMEDKLHAEECLALDAGTLAMLLSALRAESDGRALHIKLPPDVGPILPEEFEQEIRPQGVMGIANVSALLRAIIGDAGYVFEVLDASVPQNAGVWDGMGGFSRRHPQLRLEAGRLGQFLDGYRSLAELVEAGEAEALDPEAVRALDAAFPKQCCFIIDEY